MKLTNTAKRRLLMFCRYMENLPKSTSEHFRMDSWFDHDGDHDHGFKPGQVVKPSHVRSCGTAACALGFASIVPQLQKVGLNMRFSEFGGSADFYFKGKEVDPYYGASQTFDIPRERAVDLFSMVGKCAYAKTPKEWADMARKLVREWK